MPAILTIIIAFQLAQVGEPTSCISIGNAASLGSCHHHDLTHPMLFMTICFAAVMDGSVFGDQCSRHSYNCFMQCVGD